MTKLYEKASINDITGAMLVSKAPTNAFREGYNRVFKYSFFDMNKLYKKQYVDLYNDGWTLYAVEGELAAEENKGITLLLKNEFNDMMERFLTLE